MDRHKLTVLYLKSFDMDSVQVGKAVFGNEIHTTPGIKPRTILQSGAVRQPFVGVPGNDGSIEVVRKVHEQYVLYLQN